MAYTHEMAPRPTSKPVPLDKVDTVDEAVDYALGGFHASLEAGKKAGAKADRWATAAGAYHAAYLALLALKALPADQGVPKAKQMIKQADEKADNAAGRIYDHDMAPRPKAKPVAMDRIDQIDEAEDYALGGFHASVDKAEGDGSDPSWYGAAGAYLTAYLSIVGLKATPGPAAVTKARELLKDADQKADQAVANA